MDTNTIYNTYSKIVEDWYGGYKLKFDLTSQKGIADWKLQFDLPYYVSASYGVDVIENDNGTYTIKGQDGWADLRDGQSIESILIVEDNGQEALPLDFETLESSSNIEPILGDNPQEIIATTSEYTSDSDEAASEETLDSDTAASEDTSDSDTIASEDTSDSDEAESEETLDSDTIASEDTLDSDTTASEDTLDSDTTEGEDTSDSDTIASEDTSDSDTIASEDTLDSDTTASEDALDLSSYDTTINVDNDFGGDLAAAIASASDGDAIELNGRTYYTSGLTINKDITIFGQEGATIDGGGTSNSIINITPGASGATIDNIDITNGNNGIYSYGASNLTLQNLDVYNIGNSERFSGGENNTGIILNYATGVNLNNSNIFDIGRKGVSIGDTNGATVSGLTVENINLAAEHAQSHDAAGIKFFNTNDVVVRDSLFANINANNIWNDTTSNTTIENNTIENVGSVFRKPSFNSNVDISGIYNEKSYSSVVRYNTISSVEDFAAYNGTEFTTETVSVYENNFSIIEENTPDYWVNEEIEKLIAITEDPAEADFSLFQEEYFAVAVID